VKNTIKCKACITLENSFHAKNLSNISCLTNYLSNHAKWTYTMQYIVTKAYYVAIITLTTTYIYECLCDAQRKREKNFSHAPVRTNTLPPTDISISPHLTSCYFRKVRMPWKAQMRTSHGNPPVKRKTCMTVQMAICNGHAMHTRAITYVTIYVTNHA
jgi:hypothetical protein